MIIVTDTIKIIFLHSANGIFTDGGIIILFYGSPPNIFNGAVLDPCSVVILKLTSSTVPIKSSTVVPLYV